MRRAVYIVMGIVGFFIFIYILNKKQRYQECKRYKELEMIGIVTNKFIDSNKKNTPYISIRDSFESFYMFDYDVWSYISIGDSIVKDTGSFKFTIYRRGAYSNTFYYKECN